MAFVVHPVALCTSIVSAGSLFSRMLRRSLVRPASRSSWTKVGKIAEVCLFPHWAASTLHFVTGGDSDEAFRNTSNYGTYIASMHAAAFNAGISATTMWLWQDQYYVWPLQVRAAWALIGVTRVFTVGSGLPLPSRMLQTATPFTMACTVGGSSRGCHTTPPCDLHITHCPCFHGTTARAFN